MKEELGKSNIIYKKVIPIICLIVIIITIIYLYYSHNRRYKGDYQTVKYYGINSSTKEINKEEPYRLINSYSEYVKVLKMVEEYGWTDVEYKYNSSFFEENSLVLVEILEVGVPSMVTKLTLVNEHNKSVNIEIYTDGYGCTAEVRGDLYLIPISKNVTKANIKYVNEGTYKEDIIIGIRIIIIAIVTFFVVLCKRDDESNKKIILKILKISIALIIILFFVQVRLAVHELKTATIYKPIIYLYPTEDKEVTVKLRYDKNITVSYPKYITGWNVLAKTDGNLIDLATNKKLYALYYESKNIEKFKVENDGFVVKGENIANFLEEKLDILGLNEREKEEFIIYWIPKLEKNEYNYIRFATMDEINNNMPLDINPNPDTLIRVWMTYKKLNRPIEIKEQKLITPERNGFVAVEWGGTEIK